MTKYRALCSVAILGLVATVFAGCGDGDNTLTKICNPAEASCASEEAGTVCSADGTRVIEFSCSEGEVCDDGTCTGECTPGAQRCASDAAAQVCSEDGREWVAVPCPPGTACEDEEGCVPTPGEGIEVCEPGATACADARTAKVCDADGSGWILTTCEDDEHCVDGECVFNDGSACTPRERQCVDGNSVQCNDDGDGWIVTECPDSAPCANGVCQGSVCEPGSTKCADLPFAFEGWFGYDFGALYTCNEDGDGWELSHCSAGEYCVYDHITDAEVDDYVSQLGLWYVGGEWPQMDLSDSRASCQEPGCPMPHEYRNLLSLFAWGNPDTEIASSFCGSPDAPTFPGDSANEYTQCEGLPPFQNLEWVTYQCPEDYEACAVESLEDYDNAYCSSECTPGTVICWDDDSTSTCQEDGTWGSPEQCPTEGELEYELQCRQVSDFLGGVTAACLDPVCAYWLDSSGTGDLPGVELPETFGACTPDGQFRPCQNGVLGEASSCDGVCLTEVDLSSLEGYSNTADQDPGQCGVECEDGQTRCVHAESTGSPLYQECVDGRWSAQYETCEGNAVCWDGGDLEHGAALDREYFTYTFQFGDFLPEVICGGECNPGRTVCYGDQMMTCGANGQWEVPVDCPFGVCEDQGAYVQCEAECIPGTLSCFPNGGDLPNDSSPEEYLCTPDGRWSGATVCDTSDIDAPEACRVDSKGVVLGCVQCVGPDTNGNNEQVADSQCRAANTALRTCTASNTWGPDVACGGGDLCTSAGFTAWCYTPAL